MIIIATSNAIHNMDDLIMLLLRSCLIDEKLYYQSSLVSSLVATSFIMELSWYHKYSGSCGDRCGVRSCLRKKATNPIILHKNTFLCKVNHII